VLGYQQAKKILLLIGEIHDDPVKWHTEERLRHWPQYDGHA
jgi:hypothetical protein